MRKVKLTSRKTGKSVIASQRITKAPLKRGDRLV